MGGGASLQHCLQPLQRLSLQPGGCCVSADEGGAGRQGGANRHDAVHERGRVCELVACDPLLRHWQELHD